jgi:transcriptional regulator with XRE-family HTH domain
LPEERRSPTLRRRELGALLRTLRGEQGLTVEQVAEQLLCSPSKVSRMETGHRGATQRDVRDLCALYGVNDPDERDRMMRLARESKQQGWWQSYDLQYSTYVGLEAEAISIGSFHSVIPGLLQTPDYARAGDEATIPRLPDAQIDQMIEAKLKRQSILTQANPPSFAAVIDEAALRRVTGGPEVMVEQLGKLLATADLPNVTIQVLPFAAGMHPALESNFNILELPDPASDLVYVEGLAGSTYLERDADLDKYREVMARLQSLALSSADTIGLMRDVLLTYKNLKFTSHALT